MAWLSGWGFRKEITIQDTNVDSNLTDFPCYVKIDADADFHEARADGYDIRFTQSDGETLLKYGREYWTGGNGSAATAHFWVKVPSVLATGGAVIYCYYGKSDASDGEDAANVWDANFVGVWHLEESSNPYLDATSNNNDSTSGTYPDRIAGKIGYGQDFDSGNSEYIGIPDDATLEGMGLLTLSAWFNVDDVDNDHIVLCKGNYFYALDLREANDKIWFFTITETGTEYNLSNGALSVDTWYHVVGVYDGSDTWIYIDGAVQTDTDTQSGNIKTDGTTVMSIGRQGQLDDRYWDGVIDEVRISDTNRSAAWIKFEYNNINEADQELTWGNEEEEEAGVTLVVADGAHAHSTDAILLSQIHQLIVQAADHGHLVDSPALTQAHVLAIAEALHAHAADNIALTQAHTLAIVETLHNHTTDPIALFQAHQIAIDDALHDHTTSSILLSQIHQLIVSESVHSHTADNIVLTLGALLVVADALHGHSADDITLSQVHQLLVNSGLHSLASDPIILSQIHSLVVSDAGHNHLADNITLIYGQMFPIIFDVEPRERVFNVEARRRMKDVSSRKRIFDVKRRG